MICLVIPCGRSDYCAHLLTDCYFWKVSFVLRPTSLNFSNCIMQSRKELDFKCAGAQLGSSDSDENATAFPTEDREMLHKISTQLKKLDFLKAAHLGHGAPNTEVVQLQDQRCSRILDYAKDKRPLILNFGSCS